MSAVAHYLLNNLVQVAFLLIFAPLLEGVLARLEEIIQGKLDKLLRPVVAEQTEQHGAFTAAIHRQVEMVHVVDRLTLTPLIGWAYRVAARLARMHHGRVTLYASYILAVLVAALLIASAALP